MSKRRAPKQTKDCHNCVWANGPSLRAILTLKLLRRPKLPAEVQHHALATENVRLSKKKWKLSLTKPKKAAAIQSKTIMAILCSLGSSALRHIRLYLEPAFDRQ